MDSKAVRLIWCSSLSRRSEIRSTQGASQAYSLMALMPAKASEIAFTLASEHAIVFSLISPICKCAPLSDCGTIDFTQIPLSSICQLSANCLMCRPLRARGPCCHCALT